MIELSVKAFKVTVVLTSDQLSKLNAANPVVLFDLDGGAKVPCRLNPKSVRKTQANTNATGGLIQGRLICEQGGQLALVDAGMSAIEPKPSREFARMNAWILLTPSISTRGVMSTSTSAENIAPLAGRPPSASLPSW